MKNWFRPKYRPLLPGEKIEIAFLFQAGTVWPSWESVYRTCNADERFNVRLILITESTVETSHSEGAEQFLRDNKLPYTCDKDVDFSSYCPHVVLHQFPYDAAFHTPDLLSLRFAERGSRVVYIPYGLEISDTPTARKDHFNSRVVENAWRIYTSSEGFRAEYLKYCRNRQAVRVTGSPKFDGLFEKDHHRLSLEIAEKAQRRPLIVWKIHFPRRIGVDGQSRMITPELSEYLQFAEKLDQFEDFFFVVLPHPKMAGKLVASDFLGDVSLARDSRELLKKLSGKSNVFLDFSKDYRNSLYHADAVVIDRSSTMVEAAMLDVPMLVMKNAGFYEPMTTPVQEIADSCRQGTTCEDICVFLRELRGSWTQTSKHRQKLIDKWFLPLDGKCGKRIAEDICASIKEEQATLPKPQIILYGTGEVFQYYMKHQWASRSDFDIVAISDSSADKWGEDLFGYRVIAPETIQQLYFDAIVIMTEPHYYEIKKSLVCDLYLDERKIILLDEFLLKIGEI